MSSGLGQWQNQAVINTIDRHRFYVTNEATYITEQKKSLLKRTEIISLGLKKYISPHGNLL